MHWRGIDDLISKLSLDKLNAPLEQVSQCENRDIFQARLDNLYHEISDPLLISICGEIGNNAFDHNLGNWRDISGLYFNSTNKKEKIIVFADRGQGVKSSLSRILPDLPDDLSALQTAFTRVISGRSPEQRGNGLKFVAAVVKKKNWELYFHSGNAFANITQGGITFSSAKKEVKGCLVVLKYT